MADPALEPLKPPDARKLAREIFENGKVEISGHAREEMLKDNLATTDCLNLVRAGSFEAPEHINGEWRYRITTKRICVVITFKSIDRLRVVTAWRLDE
jgi:hypothetical protein